MKKILGLFVLLFFSTILIQCSKTEDPNTDNNSKVTTIKVSGYQFQVVEIPVVDLTLSQEKYSASLGDSLITLYRNTDSTLVTTIPMLPVGEYTLTIVGLEGFLVTVTVSETILETTPEIILSGISTSLNAIAISIPDTSGNEVLMDKAIHLI